MMINDYFYVNLSNHLKTKGTLDGKIDPDTLDYQ